MICVEETILSKYSGTSNIGGIVKGLNPFIDPRADIDAFYAIVFNVETASKHGLDIWGRIVGIPRILTINKPNAFGFQTTGYACFGDAPFWDGETFDDHYDLNDDQYRKLILLKSAANISNCTPTALNRLLTNLFSGRGDCYVLNLGNMRMRYVFEFYLAPWERTILLSEYITLNPAGVGVEIYEFDRKNTFGFKMTGFKPFNQGTFRQIGIQNA